MPTSCIDFKADIKNYLIGKYKSDITILDVGAGVGTFSKLLRSNFPNIDGCEVFEPYIEKYKLKQKYNNIFVANICEFNFDYYDLIIMGDILEHLSAEDGKRVIESFKTKCKEAIICVPWRMRQGVWYNNKYEIHLQFDLTLEVMKERYPSLTPMGFNKKYGWFSQINDIQK